MISVLGKACNHRAPNLSCTGTESPGWFDVSPKNSAWCMRYELARCLNEVANHQVSTAAAFCIIRIVSMEECSSLTQNLMQICCSAHSVILYATTTQYTCSLNNIHWHQWLAHVQTSGCFCFTPLPLELSWCWYCFLYIKTLVCISGVASNIWHSSFSFLINFSLWPSVALELSTCLTQILLRQASKPGQVE